MRRQSRQTRGANAGISASSAFKSPTPSLAWALRLLPYVAVATYSVVLSYLSVLRYETFTDAWDFGGFVQSISNATKGGFFLQTIDAYFAKGFPETEVISFFGLHFGPILYLLVPIYAAFPYPETLLVVQTVVLAFGALPVYWLARKRLGAFAACVFLVIYLTYPPLIGINLNDFHNETFISTFMLYAIYFGLERQWKKTAPFLILTLLVIEEAGLLVAAFVVFLFVYHRAWRDRRLSTGFVATALGSAAYTAVAASLPVYFGLDPNGFTVVLNAENYSVLGASSVLGIPEALVRSPHLILSALSYQFANKVSFIVALIGPVAFLPLFFPEGFIMAAPWIGTAFFSNYAGYYTIYGFHPAFILFFVFPTAILGLERVRRRSPKITPRIFKGYLGVMLVVGLLFSVAQAFPPYVYGSSFVVTPQNLAEQRLVNLVPSNASVLTTSDIFPHLANDINAYTIPPSTLRPQYATTDVQILSHIDPHYILLNMGSGDGIVIAERNAILTAKVYNGTYGLLAFTQKIMLLEEGYRGQPIVYENTLTYNSTNLVFDTRWTSAGENNTLVFSQGTNNVNMWFGPYSFIPAGNYSATFAIKISGPVAPQAPVITLDVDYGNLVTVQSRLLTGADFPNSGWQKFTITFQIPKAVVDIQLRGMYPTNSTSIYLQSIVVMPTP